MTVQAKEALKKAKILHLTLKRPPFEVMKTGEKPIEFRRPSPWLFSRLIESKTGKKKTYDFVCFKNGYNMDSEFFYTIYCEFYIAEEPGVRHYTNGLKVNFEKGDVLICCGRVCTLEEVLRYIEIKYGS